MARDANGYNDAALVNLGNCCYKQGDFEKAREHYIAALEIDASCVEALYNLGELKLYIYLISFYIIKADSLNYH